MTTDCSASISDTRRPSLVVGLVVLLLTALILTPGFAQDAATDWPELSDQAPRLPFAEAAFRDCDGLPRSLSQSQLTRWLAPVPGQNHRFFEAPRGPGIVAGYEGLVRLRAPWQADAVLSLTPFDHHGMAVYFWNGRSGLSLHYFLHPRPNWAAYRITRKDTELQPATYALLGTDNDVYARSLGGSIEIRHQDGSLVVSRGDFRLLTVPCPELPAEVYFDKKAWFRTFSMYRGEPYPGLDPAEVPLDADAPDKAKNPSPPTPAAMDWPVQPAAGSTFRRLPDGSIEFTSDAMAATSWTAVKVPTTGLQEVVVQLGEATPGTGIYLGDDTGKPLYVLYVMRDQRTKLPALQFLPPTAAAFEIVADINQLQAPYIGAGQWLRLVTGSGTLKCWTSGDGQHWSRVLDPVRSIRGGWSHVGVISSKWNEARRLVLRQLRVTPFPELAGFADPQLAARVPADVINGDPAPPAWQARVVASLPPGIDIGPWRAACALRTLTAVPPAALGNLLLLRMAEENLAHRVPLAQRLATLQRLAELYDAWDHADCLRLSQAYEQLARQAIREGDRAPWTNVARALISAPLATNAQYQTIPESLANAELLFRIAQDDWSAVRHLCRELTLYSRPAPPELGWPDTRMRTRLLVEWARAHAEREAAPAADGVSQATIPLAWQHPLLVNSSKEGFNTLAELEATLGEQSYKDACQIITSAPPDQALGLFPDTRDARLLLSLPQTISQAMHDHPPLQQMMVAQFSNIGRLRLQQAAADGNPRTVQALAVQFMGTAAAATARQWLGDRFLVMGHFVGAEAEYAEALKSCEPDQRPALAARLRLAAAMLGRDAGQPVTQTVVLETVKLAPDAFERLVTEMKQQAAAKGLAVPVAPEPAQHTGIRAVKYDAQPRLAPRGDVGENPGNSLAGEIDWAARQLSGALVKDVLYFFNRFQLTAFNVRTRQQLWTVPVGKEQGPSNGWPLTSMKPVVAGDRLYVRRLAKINPEIVCLNATTGQVRWTTRNTLNVASDPLVVQDRVYAFSFTPPADNGQAALDFCQFDAQTGDLISQQPVLQLRNHWERQLSCQAVIVGTRLVSVAGGTVFSCDFAGNTAWVRRQPWIPPPQFPASNEQTPARPLAIDNRLYVTQPGVFAIECLDLDTGRRIWQEPIPELRRVLGLSGERLIVETARGWEAHAVADGKLLWQHDAEQVLDAYLCPTGGDLLVARREVQQADVWRCVLVWLNTETGQEQARWPLEPCTDRQPFLGPLFVDQDRLWLFYGRGNRDPHRDLFELTPTNDPALAPRFARE